MPGSPLTSKRILIAVLAAATLCWATWQAARTGQARHLSRHAAQTNDLAAADRAVAVSSSDAETHLVRGEALFRTEDFPAAQLELERAVQLRPRDYYLWLLLGVTRDQRRDRDGALPALRQSVALAPKYAAPRWQIGNVLLRMGRVEEAFAEMRHAASGDPTLLPIVIDLMWGTYGGNSSAVVSALQPETDDARLALAHFFARHNQGAAAVAQFSYTRAPSEEKSEALLTELLKAKSFTDAYQVWTVLRGLAATEAFGVIRDGGFEDSVTIGKAGFGWQIAPGIANVVMSVDNEHRTGSRSLRIEFRGNSDPAKALVTQLVLVRPQMSYLLTFASRSKDFVSGAAPVVTIIDASDQKRAMLAESPPLRSDAIEWREFTLDFVTPAKTQAVLISIARQSCADNPCPAFGNIWLDSFRMTAR